MVLIVALGTVATAAQPPAGAPVPSGGKNGSVPDNATSGDGTPDDDFIEFLGSDDVGDTDLWEFLKNSGQRPAQPATAPAQQESQP
jgi:hypothetical protein